MKAPTPEIKETVVRNRITTPDIWIKDLAIQTDSKVEGNVLICNSNFADGTIRWDEIQKGFYIAKSDFTLMRDISVVREQTLEDGFYMMKFQINDTSIEHSIDGEIEELGVSKKYGIVFSTPNTTTMIRYKKHTPIKMFTIILSKQWLSENVLCDKQTGFWHNTLSSNQSIHVYKPIDQRYISNLEAIYAGGSLIGHLHALNLLTSILSEFFMEPEQKVVINKTEAQEFDLSSFLDAKENLEYHWQEAPHIEEICEDTGLSESQFKKSFKKIFGYSPYKHYLNYRMQRAKELLLTGRYTISEVSYMLGYENLTKFSKAFKKCLGMLPSQYIRLIV
mgnify:CR=1 FL=1